jgi:hypothetical protein
MQYSRNRTYVNKYNFTIGTMNSAHFAHGQRNHAEKSLVCHHQL